MKISEIKRNARQALKGKWGFAILLVIIVFAINSIISSISNVFFGGGIAVSNGSLGYHFNVGNLLTFLLTPLTVGCSWVFLSLVRGEDIEISHLFRLFTDGKRYIKTIGLALLVLLFTTLWTLLFIIPGIIKGLAYSQVYYLYKDHPEYKITQLITESRNLMDGYKWKYFLLNLSFIGWGILSIFTLGIGLLWLVPYIDASLAEFYRQRVDTSEDAI